MSLSPPSAQRPRHTFRREQRLRRQSDFEALREHGTSRAHPLVILRATPNAFPYPRFAFVVGRRVTRKAVIRNRIRRRMREVARRAPFAEGWDLMFIARREAAEATFAALQEAIWSLAERARVLSSAEQPDSMVTEG